MMTEEGVGLNSGCTGGSSAPPPSHLSGPAGSALGSSSEEGPVLMEVGGGGSRVQSLGEPVPLQLRKSTQNPGTSPDPRPKTKTITEASSVGSFGDSSESHRCFG